MVETLRMKLVRAAGSRSRATRYSPSPKALKSLLSALTFLVTLTPLHGQERGLFAPLEAGPGSRVMTESVVSDELAKRLRVVAIDFSMLDNLSAAAPDEPRGTSRLAFNLFDDAVFTGVVERREPTYSGGHAFTGRIAEDPLGTMALVVNGETVVGTVRTSRGTYRIRSAGGGRYAVSELDRWKLPEQCNLLRPRRHDRDTGRYTFEPTLDE